jgi:hypothetical protein
MTSQRAIALYLLLLPAVGAGLTILAETVIGSDDPLIVPEKLVIYLPLALPAIAAVGRRPYVQAQFWAFGATVMTFGFLLAGVVVFLALSDDPANPCPNHRIYC